jgi:hypothetical protein
MTRILKNLEREIITLWDGALTIMAPPKTILASAKKLEDMIDKLRKQQQQIIEIADPGSCRHFLPLIEKSLEGLQHRQTLDELHKASALSAAIRKFVAVNKKSKKVMKYARR